MYTEDNSNLTCALDYLAKSHLKSNTDNINYKKQERITMAALTEEILRYGLDK
jgi:hypothetical protein